MKKMMTSAMALLLCLSMLFSFAACSGDNGGNGGNGGENTVVGDWECIVDADEAYSKMLGTEVHGCQMRITFQFAANGEARMAFDEEFFNARLPEFVDSIVNVACEKQGIDVETYYAMAGVTRDQLISIMENNVGELAHMAKQDGTYEIEGNKIWFLTEGQTKDDNKPMLFSFDGGKLLLTAEDTSNAPEGLAELLPLTLTRI